MSAERSGYDLARRRLAELDASLREQQSLADDVAKLLLPPLPRAADPRDPDAELAERLRALQLVLLRHPVAARAAIAGLVAEGRRFAESAEGAQHKRDLEGSALLQNARLVWKMVSLGSFDADAPEILPSAYLEGVLLAAAGDDPDRVLDRLFGGGPPGGARNR